MIANTFSTVVADLEDLVIQSPAHEQTAIKRLQNDAETVWLNLAEIVLRLDSFAAQTGIGLAVGLRDRVREIMGAFPPEPDMEEEE